MKKNYLIISLIILIVIIFGAVTTLWIKKDKNNSNKNSAQQEKSISRQKIFEKNVNVCDIVSQKEISQLLGKPVTKVEKGDLKINPAPACFYYLDEKHTVYIELDANKDINTQIKGYEILGWKAEKNQKIPIDNYVIHNKEGQLYIIFLLPNKNNYITINPWASSLTEEEVINFTAKFTDYLKQNFDF